MAKQSTRFIDVTRSYLPVDPNSYFETLSLIGKSDYPEQSKEVVAYEGYNFMPTSYGYKSYFGTAAKLGIDDLSARVDDLFVIQTQTFQNIAVALTEIGIYTKEADSSGAWGLVIPMDAPAEGVHYNWTKCMIGNELFCYRATNSTYAVFSPVARAVSQGEIEAGATPGTHPANEFYEVAPNFLNMEGQQGIFKAGSRLGFWDSANSIGVSSVDDYAQFTPNIKTGASNVLFNEIKGRITQIYALDDGFIIYATRSIVSIRRNTESTMQWQPTVLLQDNGVAFQRECCTGENTSTHYAYTSTGLFKITDDKAEPIAVAVVDFLRESEEPIFLKVIDNRYLFLEILDSNYVDGLVSFTVETIPASVQVYPPFNKFWNQAASEAAYTDLHTLSVDAYELLDNYLVANELALRKEGTSITPVYNYSWGAYAQAGYVAADWPVGAWETGAIIADAFEFSNATVQALFDDAFNVGETIYTSFYAATDELGEVFNCRPSINIDYGTPPAPTSYKDFLDRTIEYQDLAASTARSRMTLLNAGYPFDINSPCVIGNVDKVGSPESLSFLISALSPSETYSGPPPQGYPSVGETLSITLTDGYFFDITMPEAVDVGAITLSYDTLVGHSETKYTAFAPYWEVETSSSRVTLRRRSAISGTIGGRVAMIAEPQGGNPDNLLIKAWLEPTYAETEDGSYLETSYAEIVGYNYTDEDDVEQFVAFNALDSLVNLEGGQSYTFTDSGLINYPPVSFLLQDGSIGPVYPTIPGALVYDTLLEKWGKMRGDYKLLVDWKPLNNSSGETIPYEVFGMQGGILDTFGAIRLFDMFPVDSYLRYGKMGHHREGFTKLDEVIVRFRSLCTGTLRSDSSLDGYAVELGFSRELSFTEELVIRLTPNISARWHSISLTGIFDIRYLEYRAHAVSNR